MTCKTDCGRCVYCTEHDDYGPAWRNPLFQAATSTDRGRPATETPRGDDGALAGVRNAGRPVVPVLGRDGGEHV